MLTPFVASACASNPAARRATAIADADRDARSALAAERRLDVRSIPARSLAVMPFTVAEHDTLLTPLGFGLADLLMTDLAMSPQLQMVERLRIDAILRELQLVDQGVTDPATAPRAGRLMGARRLLIGTVTTTASGIVQLHARVVDVADGTVQELVIAEAPLGRIIDAEKALALLVFDRLGVRLTPAQRLAVEQRQTTQLAALVAFGRGAQADAHGDPVGALAAFADAARLDASFAAARTSLAGVPSFGVRTTSVQRVLALSTQALNQPASTQVSEAADAALSTSLSVPIVVTIRVIP
jgi:curli biogenesis system outer membrane secretion channel CsgG